MFNPRATLQTVALDERRYCWVIDDALLEPERLVQWAGAARGQFRAVDFNAYPGIYLPAPPAVVHGLNEFFRQRVRDRFDARRCVSLHCRLSMVTVAPRALRPIQWLCHRDDFGIDARLTIPASVLYLFKDVELGGTSFYAPTVSPAELTALFRDAQTLPIADFTQRHGLTAAYLRGDNPYFKCLGVIPPKWNRLIFYDGAELHSGDIAAPEKLSDDPLVGRLTLNGFFTCRRHLPRRSQKN